MFLLLILLLSFFASFISSQDMIDKSIMQKESKQNVLDIVTPLPALQQLIHGYLEGSLKQIFSISNQIAMNAAFSPQEPYLVRTITIPVNEQRTHTQVIVQLFNLENQENKIITHKIASLSKGIAFSPDGKFLAIGFNNIQSDNTDNFEIWETTNWTKVKSLKLSPIEDLKYSPNGAYIATVGNMGSHLIDTKTWAIKTINEKKDIIAFSPDSSLVALANILFSNNVALIKTNDGSLTSITAPGIPPAYNHGINDIAFASDNKSIILRTRQNSITIWDSTTGKLIRALPVNKQIGGIAIHPTDPIFITFEYINKIHVWNATTGELIKSFSPDIKSNRLSTIHFSPDGQYMLITSNDGAHLRGYNNNTKFDLAYKNDSNSIVSPNFKYLAFLSPFGAIEIDLPHPITLDISSKS